MTTAVLEQPKRATLPRSEAVAFGAFEDAAFTDPFEVVDGTHVEKPLMGALAGMVAIELVHAIKLFAARNRLGFAAAEVLFRLAAGLLRRPDVAFVSAERAKASPLSPDDTPAWDVVPDLAIEIVSPTNTAVELLARVDEYFAAGVRAVWLVYPTKRRAYCYDSPAQVRIVPSDGELEGGSVLPGFRAPLSQMFPDFTPTA